VKLKAFAHFQEKLQAINIFLEHYKITIASF
jgi:hypothetical protein